MQGYVRLASSVPPGLRAVLYGLAIASLAACSNSAPRPSRPIAGNAAMGAVSGVSSEAPVAGDSAIESVEPWSFNSNEGRLVRTAHYRLFTTQADTVLNSRIPLFLESALDAYRTSITGTHAPLPEPELKLDTYILRTRPDWALLTRQMTGNQADLFLRIPRGGFAFGGKALMFDIGARDTIAIVSHEGWHQYTQRAFKRPLPVWIEEGMATYMEGHRFDGKGAPQFLPWFNTERFDQLRRAHTAGQLMSLPALLDSSPQNLLSGGGAGGGLNPNADALVYYAQVWALTLFLAEGAGGRYHAPLGTLLRDGASGEIDAQLGRAFGAGNAARILAFRRGPGVFTAYFGDLGAAAREYDAFIKRLVHPGSRNAVVEGVSPFARPE